MLKPDNKWEIFFYQAETKMSGQICTETMLKAIIASFSSR